MLGVLGPSPHAAVDRFDAHRDGPAFAGLYHRWVRGEDLAALMGVLRWMREDAGSMGGFFMKGYDERHEDVGPALASFSERARALAADAPAPRGGRQGSVVTKIETLGKRQSEFQDLIGKETEFILEDAGTWPDGNPKPLKVKRPSTFGQGGGDGRSPARAPRDEATIQQAMDRRTALMQAVAADAEAWEPIANQMYDWLRKTAGEGSHGEGVPSPATTSAPAAGTAQPSGEKPSTGHDLGVSAPSDGGGPHVHHYERIPNVTKYLRCVCGATEKV